MDGEFDIYSVCISFVNAKWKNWPFNGMREDDMKRWVRAYNFHLTSRLQSELSGELTTSPHISIKTLCTAKKYFGYSLS